RRPAGRARGGHRRRGDRRTRARRAGPVPTDGGVMTTTTAPGPGATPQASPRHDVVVGLVSLRRRDRGRGVAVTVVLVGLLAALTLVALAWGNEWLSPTEVLTALTREDDPRRLVVTVLRLPRVVLAAAVGAALGLSGAL